MNDADDPRIDGYNARTIREMDADDHTHPPAWFMGCPACGQEQTQLEIERARRASMLTQQEAEDMARTAVEQERARHAALVAAARDMADREEALQRLCAALRVGGRTPEHALDTLDRTAEAPAAIRAVLDGEPR